MRQHKGPSRGFSVLAAAALALGLFGWSSAAFAKSGSAKPWIIATIGTLSGSEGPAYGGCSVAVKAWADQVNAQGGINGHPIRLIVEDDQSSGPLGLTEVMNLWQNDHIDAIVSSCTNEDSAWMPYAISHGIPIIGGQATDSYWSSSKYVFPDATGFPSFNYSVADGAKTAGFKTFGVAYCEEAPSCAEGVPAIAASAKSIGLDMVWKGEVAGTETSYTAQCLSAKQSGAQAILVEAVVGVFPRFVSDCAAQSYTPYYLSSGFSTTPDLASVAGLQNRMVGIMLTFPWVQDNTPATKAFHAAMKKYAPHTAIANSASTADGWLSAQIFEYAAKRVTGDPSTAALLHSMWTSFHDQTLGGLMPPTTYHEAPNVATKCFTFVGIAHDKYDLPWGAGFRCQP
jgi:branched-chain amino acid transport system substrate-binding protein